MTPLRIEKVEPHSPDVCAVLAQSHAMMQRLFEPDACHYLDLDALSVPQMSLFGAYQEETLLGTGGLFDHGTYGEIKSMFTLEAARGMGVARALLSMIEAQSCKQNHTHLRLETGDVLTAARKLYAQSGFLECLPFGAYKAHPSSVFMEKPLD